MQAIHIHARMRIRFNLKIFFVDNRKIFKMKLTTTSNNEYTITDCAKYLRKNGTNTASARIKQFGIIIAEIHSVHTRPLQWCRKRPHSIEYKTVVEQLNMFISDADVKEIMAIVN